VARSPLRGSSQRIRHCLCNQHNGKAACHLTTHVIRRKRLQSRNPGTRDDRLLFEPPSLDCRSDRQIQNGVVE
jgi:hypothetical protein